MANKFAKYFKKSLVKEAALPAPITEQPPIDDAAALQGSFEDEANAQQLDTEVSNATVSPEQRASILKKADKYAEQISSIMLPMLRRLHDSIVSGEFREIAPEVKGISDITGKLAELSENLRGKTRDAILKANKNDEK